MKYLAFFIMFVPLSVLIGLLLGIAFWSSAVGFIGAGFALGLSADVCFNGRKS